MIRKKAFVSSTSSVVKGPPYLFLPRSIRRGISSFQEIKAFLIALSFFTFLYVSEHYHYRVRDEVVNEQFLVEEIYEREIHLAAEYERERREELRSMFGHLASASRLQYYAINADQDSLHSD